LSLGGLRELALVCDGTMESQALATPLLPPFVVIASYYCCDNVTTMMVMKKKTMTRR
jgi:hypothetical protein